LVVGCRGDDEARAVPSENSAVASDLNDSGLEPSDSESAVVGADLVVRPLLNELRAEETRLLERYRWVDREAGIAAIPIDRAIEVLVASGALEARGDSLLDVTAAGP
jgi:hypothetical protein